MADQRIFVIVGASLAGAKAAEALRDEGFDGTAVLIGEERERPYERPPLSKDYLVGKAGRDSIYVHPESWYAEHEVDLRLGVPATAIDRNEEIRADAVLIGVGITPAAELAEQAGLEVDNGIRVTELLQTTRDPDIFAAGDCMNADHPLYRRPIRVEHWANALNAGPAAARSMLGTGSPYDRVPYFFSDQYDLGLEFSGYFAPDDVARIVYRGDRERREFIAFWLDDENRILAGMNVNVWDVTEPIQALIRSQRPVDSAKLTDPDVALSDLI